MQNEPFSVFSPIARPRGTAAAAAAAAADVDNPFVNVTSSSLSTSHATSSAFVIADNNSGTSSGPSSSILPPPSLSSSVSLSTSAPATASNSTVVSTDCFACKKRRITCDRQSPSCRKCAKKGIPCPGYERPKIVWNKGVASKGRLRGFEYQVPEDVGRASARVSKTESKKRVAPEKRLPAGYTSRIEFDTPKKVPLRDIGYTFAVNLSTSQYADSDEGTEGCRDDDEALEGDEGVTDLMEIQDDRSLSPSSSDDSSVICVPRLRDPYFYLIDASSRDTIAFYQDRTCLAVEYFYPLRPKPGDLTCSGNNPMKYLISRAPQSPILMSVLLSVSARQRTLHMDGQSESAKNAVFIRALRQRERTIRLLRDQLAPAVTGPVTDVDEHHVICHKPHAKDLTEDELLMVMVLLLFYELMDGGQGEGFWRAHLELGKWLLEKWEISGTSLNQTMNFIRSIFEVFDAIGSTYTPAAQLPSNDIWLRFSTDDPATLSQITSSATPPYSEGESPRTYRPSPTPTTTTAWNTFKPHVFFPRSPTLTDTSPGMFTILIIPSAVQHIMHHVTALRRINASDSPIANLQGHVHAERLLASLSYFDAAAWAASYQVNTPSFANISLREYWAHGLVYQIAAEIYIRLALTLPNRTYISTLTTDLLRHMHLVPRDCLLFRSLVWPCVAAGIAVQTEEHVAQVRVLIRELCAALPCLNVDRAVEALDRWFDRKGRRKEKEVRCWEEALTVFGGSWLFL